MVWLKLQSLRVSKYLALLSAVILAGAAFSSEARSEGIAGSWRGGGTMIYASGDRERASCSAHYSGSGPVVSLNATCASASGSVSQSATLRKTGANSYAGSFFNSQYNVSGSIFIVVHGNTQSVSIRGDGMSASLTLRRL